MGHLPKLIEDLALILIAGALTTLLFKMIKQPVVLGYILAGFLVGPHLSITPTVVDNENVKTLAEIGVIFLLFSLGLEFSFKKLVRVGGSASITAFVEIIFITVTGYFTGRWMGWSFMDSLFLGGMLASSSTTIIIRAFDEMGIKTKQFAGIVFGVLIVEDIVVILLMVLLSTMAVSQQFEGTELLFTVLKLLFFLLLWFLAGVFLLPTLLKRAKSFLDEETLMILSIGLCLGMVILATQVGFSAELGAFIMGSIFAETTSAEKVEHVIKPVKDLFGAVFFVSVGMLIDPNAIVEYKWPVLFITLLTIFGKLFSTTLGALISGQPLKQSVQVGMSMAQIGEFAFIVATLGLSLGVISDFLFPVAVGASAITTFTTPYMIKYSPNLYNFLVKILPAKWILRLENYSASTQKIQSESNWKSIIKSYAIIVVANGIILISLFLLSINFLVPVIEKYFSNLLVADAIALVATLLLASPFLWALMSKKPNTVAYKELWINGKYNRGPLVVIEVIRNALGVVIIGFLVASLFNTRAAVLVVVPIITVVLYLFSRNIQVFYQRIEGRFLQNLNSRESESKAKDALGNSISEKNTSIQSGLKRWSAYVVDLKVGQLANFAGKRLADLAWREKYGINIAYVKRGEKLIHAPGGGEVILPFDHIGIISTEEQMQIFKPVFESTENLVPTQPLLEDIVLENISVNEFNKLKGVSIRNSGIRECTNGLIVGIEREAQRILNPESHTVFEWGDVVWIVGERKKINKLRKEAP